MSDWLDARTNAQRHLVVLVPRADVIAQWEVARDSGSSSAGAVDRHQRPQRR